MYALKVYSKARTVLTRYLRNFFFYFCLPRIDLSSIAMEKKKKTFDSLPTCCVRRVMDDPF